MSTPQIVERRPQSRRWQFSLFTLLLAMACVGLSCVALVSPSDLWSGLVFVVAVGSLLVAGLCIVYRDGHVRAFAVGFVIFGTAYFQVSLHDTPDVPEAHTTLPTTRWGIALYSVLHGSNVQSSTTVWPQTFPVPVPWQPTPVPVTSVSPPLPGQTIQRVVVTTPSTTIPNPGPDDPLAAVPSTNLPALLPPPVGYMVTTQTTAPVVRLGSFLSVVHNLLILGLGVLGGIMAQVLYSTRRETPSR